MTTVIESQFKHPVTGDVALVTMSETGEIKVTRGSKELPMGAEHTMDSVEGLFLESGWVLQTGSTEVFEGTRKSVIAVEDVAIESSPKSEAEESVTGDENIPLGILKEVDEYIKLHQEKSKLEAKLKKAKEKVSSYMKKNDITAINGSHGKQVYFQEANASNSTANYTNYEMNDIVAILNGTEHKDIIREVSEVRINAEKLEGIMKLNKLPENIVEELKERKIVKPGTPRFSVKNI